MSEFRKGIEKGYDEFRLVAGDVGAYGQDIGTNIAELFEAIFSQPGDFRVAVTDFNIQWLIKYKESMIELLNKYPSRTPNISAPLQSGSTRILKKMRRRYTSEEAKEGLLAFKERCPNLRLRPHLLVGFPGETEEDFQQTLDFLKEVDFWFIDIYQYADRPGTEATKMDNKVSNKVQRRRMRRLQKEFPETCSLTI